MLKFLSLVCLFALIRIDSITSKSTLTELIYDNQLSNLDLFEPITFEPITLSQLKAELSEDEQNNQTYSKLQLENKKLDEDLLLLVKNEEEEKLKKAQRLLKPQKMSEIVDGEVTKTPVPEEELVLQADQQINNVTTADNSTMSDNSNDNSTGLLSSIFHSVTNYLFENGTGAFFQLKQFNQNADSNDTEADQQ